MSSDRMSRMGSIRVRICAANGRELFQKAVFYFGRKIREMHCSRKNIVKNGKILGYCTLKTILCTQGRAMGGGNTSPLSSNQKNQNARANLGSLHFKLHQSIISLNSIDEQSN
jgi:hypothetical protein